MITRLSPRSLSPIRHGELLICIMHIQCHAYTLHVNTYCTFLPAHPPLRQKTGQPNDPD